MTRLVLLQVDELISSTLLNVDMEEKVFSSVIRWVKHDVAERKKHVSRVSPVTKATSGGGREAQG